MHLSFTPVVSYLVVALASAVLLGLLFIGPARSKTTTGRRRVLLALRLATVLLVVAAMLRPTVVYTSVKRQSATLVMLIDSSQSMQVADTVGNRSRWQMLKESLSNASPELSELAELYEVRPYTFDSQAKPAELVGGLVSLDAKPTGRQTAIGSVMEDVLRREAGKRLAAVLLLSDGSQRATAPNDAAPQTPARNLADSGTPLYPVVFGQSRGAGDARDVAVSDLLLASPTVFVKNQLTATATARIDGYANRPIRAELWLEGAGGKMELVDQKDIQATSEGQALPIELSGVPTVPGEHKLTIRAVQQPGELVTTNNEVSTFVTVLKGGLNVLYLEGNLQRVEKRYLREALSGAANMKVDYFYINPQAPQTRPPDLAERLRPGRYDVYILGDLDSRAFQPEELASLRQSVEKGAGLIMLGGFHSFGPGGYGKTPLAEVLPIVMGDFERQGFGEPIAADLHLVGEVRMRPTALGMQHFVLAMGKDAAAGDLWNQLPPMDGANRFRGLSPRANVLAEAAGGEPILVAQDVGPGRVMAFAGDTTWRWVLAGYNPIHRRFWRQVVLWLAHKDQSTEGDVWVELDPRRYSPGRRVEFTCGARSSTGEPVTDAQITAEIVLPDGTKRVLDLQSQAEHLSGAFADTLSPGDYAIEIKAVRGAESLGSTRARFLVDEHDIELENPVADISLMESIAAMTGGETVPPERLGELFQRLKKQATRLDLEVQATQTLWDTWAFFIALAGLLSVEWWLRKRWGLV